MYASVLLMAFAFAQAAPESTLAMERQTHALAATVRMRIADRGVGTAVVVGRKDSALYLLTADHATDGPDTTELKFEFFSDGNRTKPAFVLQKAKAAIRRPIADFALLEVSIDRDRTVSILKLAPPGTAPKKYPFEGLSVGCSDGAAPTCEKESVLGKRLALRGESEMAFFWQAEKSQVRGRSGGPLLDEAGRLIGICAATALGKGYYVHSSEIQAALKTEGYDWLWKPESKPQK